MAMKQKRESILAITMTPEEKELIINASDIDGMTMCSFARSVLLQEARKIIKEEK